MSDVCFEHEVESCPECEPQVEGEITVNPATLTTSIALARQPIPLPSVTLGVDLETASRMMLVAATSARTFADTLADSSDLDEVASVLRDLAEARREWEARRKEYLNPIDVARKDVQALFTEPGEILAGAEFVLKTAFSRIQREEQARAAAIARQQEAELDAERERLLGEAEQAEADGNLTGAEELAVQAASIPTAITAAAPKAAGVSSSLIWSAEVTDLKALASAVADGRVPDNYVLANMVALNARAKADKDGFTAVPGVRAVSRSSVRSR